MKNSIRISILMVIAIISTSNLFAATRTWDGSSSTAWGTAANWSGNTVPTTGDDVIIPTGLTNYPILSANVTVLTFEMNGGTFSTNNFNLTATNGLIVNDGVFTAGTGTIATTNGDIDITNGSFSIQYNRIATNSGGSFIVNGGTVTFTGTGDIVFPGDFEVISGTVNFNNNDIRVTDKYIFSDAIRSNEGDTFKVGRMEIDFTGTKTLSNVITVSGQVRFMNGILNTNSTDLVIFQYNSTVSTTSGEFPTNAKHINGPVIKLISSSNTTPTFIFPTGNGTFYAPIQISGYGNRRNQDYFIAQYIKARNPNAGGTKGTGLALVSQAEYWTLDRGASSGTASTTVTIQLSYNSTRSGSITDVALLKTALWNGTQWVDNGRSTGSGNTTSGTVTSSTARNAFGAFTIGSSSNVNPLPVHLLNFTASPVASNVNVKWTTTSEINNDFFNVEKSLDGKNWSVIGQVKGAGNTEALTNYNFLDANPVMGMQYYRLKQTDINGQFTYTSIAPVNFSETLISTLNIFPMPATNFINVELPGVSEMMVTIYNVNGQKVFEASSSNLLNIDIQNFNAGLYIVEVKADNNVTSAKFLKN